jgi:hypothetical protein
VCQQLWFLLFAKSKRRIDYPPSTIQDTKRYLQDFDRPQKTATSDQELFDPMTKLSALGSQSVVVDVRIPAAISRINRAGEPRVLRQNLSSEHMAKLVPCCPVARRRNT